MWQNPSIESTRLFRFPSIKPSTARIIYTPSAYRTTVLSIPARFSWWTRYELYSAACETGRPPDRYKPHITISLKNPCIFAFHQETLAYAGCHSSAAEELYMQVHAAEKRNARERSRDRRRATGFAPVPGMPLAPWSLNRRWKSAGEREHDVYTCFSFSFRRCVFVREHSEYIVCSSRCRNGIRLRVKRCGEWEREVYYKVRYLVWLGVLCQRRWGAYSFSEVVYVDTFWYRKYDGKFYWNSLIVLCCNFFHVTV